jgi:hypothetical protein
VPFSKLFCLCLGTVRGGEREPGLSTPWLRVFEILFHEKCQFSF